MTRRQINAEELNTLFTLIGGSIWHLQKVEDALHTAITLIRDVKTRGSIPQEKAEAILANYRKKTLGASLKISRKAKVLSVPLQRRLEDLNDERNWLIHNFAHKNGDDLYVTEKRYELMSRIEAFLEEAQALQKLIASELEEFVVSQGVKPEWITQEAERQLRKLKGE